MTEKVYIIEISEELSGIRLDKALSSAMAELSRTRIQALIKQGKITSDNPKISINAKSKTSFGTIYNITIPPAIEATPSPENIPLDIVFEDDDIIVINKPAGMVVHPAAGNYTGTLVNAILYHCKSSLSGIGGVARPGIVHRLDKDTSGLMVVAKHDAAHKGLSSQFENRSLSRKYMAVVWGMPSPTTGTINEMIGRSRQNRQKMAIVKENGKHAITHYKLKQSLGPHASLLTCKLETGRTHQIRVHLTHIGHPLIGDKTYGARANRRRLRNLSGDAKNTAQNFPRQALHAAALSLIHPISKEPQHFEAAPPEDMQNLMDILKIQPAV